MGATPTGATLTPCAAPVLALTAGGFPHVGRRRSLAPDGRNDVVNEAQLVDRRRREHEGVRIHLTQAAIQVIQHVRQWMPTGQQRVE